MVRVATDGAAELERALATFFLAHEAAYGHTHVRPKHHWLADIPAQFRRDDAVLDAFVIERQHLAIKVVAEPVRNTSHFEESVLASFLTVHIRDVRDFRMGDSLVGRTAPLAEVPGAVVADKLKVYGTIFGVGEVVARAGGDLATIVACAADGDGLFAIVSPLAGVAAVTLHAVRCRQAGGLAVWRAGDLQQCLAWREEPGGTVLVLTR